MERKDNQMPLLKVAEISAPNDLIRRIKELPTHEYREYDGHNEVVKRECVYLLDLMNLLNPIVQCRVTWNSCFI